MQATYFGAFGFSTAELVIILIIVLILFGAKQLPKLARSVGESARELREGLKDPKSSDSAAEAQTKE